MKFPNLKGDIITIRVNQMENHECYARSLLVKPCTFTSEKHPRAVDIKTPGEPTQEEMKKTNLLRQAGSTSTHSETGRTKDLLRLRNCDPILLQRCFKIFTFTDRDIKGINPVNQDNPVVVSIVIANLMVSMVLIDQGSFPDILLEVSPDSVHPHVGPLLVFASERVETRRYVDLITTFDQGKLSRSFTIKYLLVDPNTSYFALIGRKMLNTEILTIKVDQKQARHYYAKSLKVAPYPPIWKLTMPYPIAAEGTQVMTVDKGSQIRALTICNMGKEFDIDPRDDTSDRGPKPIEELVQLQLGPKPR
ncbi:hypothetical protein JHK85_048272 [Glycine max]|nr:hypothetical protein JHK85_048272 [Glycine max]